MAKHQLDFNIIDDVINDKEIMLFLDKSDYMENPSLPVLEVKFPNFNDYYKVPIIPNQINKLTTSALRFTDERADFPDGVYVVRYSVSPHDRTAVCKNYLRTVTLNCNIKEHLEGTSLDEKEKINLLYEIDKYLFAAKGQVEKHPNQANELFRYALKLFKQIDC